VSVSEIEIERKSERSRETDLLGPLALKIRESQEANPQVREEDGREDGKDALENHHPVVRHDRRFHLEHILRQFTRSQGQNACKYSTNPAKL